MHTLCANQLSFPGLTVYNACCREAVERAVPVVLSAEKRSTLVSLQDRLHVSFPQSAMRRINCTVPGLLRIPDMM